MSLILIYGVSFSGKSHSFHNVFALNTFQNRFSKRLYMCNIYAAILQIQVYSIYPYFKLRKTFMQKLHLPLNVCIYRKKITLFLDNEYCSD